MALGKSEAAAQMTKFLWAQKKQMGKLRVEVLNMMGASTIQDEANTSHFKAFNICDESLERMQGRIVFGDSVYSLLGRIKVQNRVKSFEIGLQKCPQMNVRDVHLQVSNDPSFKIPNRTKKYIVDNFSSKY